jgi:hypothetical protein
MNTDQLNSFIRSILKIAGAALLAHGATKAAAIVNSEDVIGVILTLAGLIASHNWHAVPDNGGAGTPKLSLLLALALPALMLTGCASAPTAAYKAESATAVTVETAMTAWGDYVAAHHPPASEELAVKAAFERYQAAELLAIDATASYVSLASTNASASGSGLSVASAGAAQALSDLVSLLQSFGVKL